MQREDERRSSGGRPSLLSSEPAADARRSSILDGLERPAGGVGAQATSKKRGKLAAIGGGVALLAVGAVGAWMWMSATPDTAPILAPAAATPQAVVPITVPVTAPSATSVVAPALAVAPAPEVAAATIIEDTAAAVTLAASPHPAKPARDELTAALERPHTPAKAKPAKTKLAEHKKPEKPAKKPAQLAKKAESKPAPQDSDVALLAALMAHVQTSRPAKETSTPGYQLKQCSRMNEAGAAQCRAHLCATTARKEPECKQQPAAVKTASES